MDISPSSYSQTYAKYMKSNTFFLSDDGWIQFLLDNTKVLKESSTYMELTEEIMMRYRYRVRDFVIEVLGNINYEQPFKVLNRIGGDLDFSISLLGVYVPDLNTVSTLRNQYNTFKNRYNKN